MPREDQKAKDAEIETIAEENQAKETAPVNEGDQDIEESEIIEEGANEGPAETAPKKRSGLLGALVFMIVVLGAAAVLMPRIFPDFPNPLAKWIGPSNSENSEASQAIIDAQTEAQNQANALNDRIAELEKQVAEANAAQGGNAELDEALTQQISDLQGKINALETSTTSAEGAAQIDLAPLKSEMEALLAQNQSLKSELDALESNVTETLTEKVEAVAVAEKTADRATQLHTLSELRLDIEKGKPFGNHISKLRQAGIDIAALEGHIEGVDSVIDLQNDFGKFAIDAIRASILASKGDGLFDGMKARISAEFTGRSLTPLEGATPDAVLSRADDALRNGNIEASLSEISVLPSEAQEALAPWVGRAEARLNLLATLDQLTANIEEK